MFQQWVRGQGNWGAAIFLLPLVPAALPAIDQAMHKHLLQAGGSQCPLELLCHGCIPNQASASVPGWHKCREKTRAEDLSRRPVAAPTRSGAGFE